MIRGALRVGVIGSNWGLMHVGAFRAAGAEVIGLCGADREKTRQRARTAAIPVATTSIAELLDTCDLVIVASPDRCHAAHVREAVAHNRHVLCEKPLAHDSRDAAGLARLVGVAGPGRGDLVLAVNFPYRFIPMMQALRRAVAGLPPVRWLSLAIINSFAAYQGQRPGASLQGESGDFGGASHAVDMALWITGAAPRWVQAELAGRPAHSVALHLGLDSGAVVELSHVATPAPGIHARLTMLGGWHGGASSSSSSSSCWESTAILAYRPENKGFWAESAYLAHGGERRCLYRRDRSAPAPDRECWAQAAVDPDRAYRTAQRDDWAEAHLLTARAVLDAIAGPGATPDPANPENPRSLATFHDGAAVQHVLAAALDSAVEQRRIPVNLP